MDCGHNYSVILKGCSRVESLGLRLEKVLLRGRLAIKMALDNMPSVVIYKGKTDSILPILNAFRSEYAAITVLADGVPPTLPFSAIYRDYTNLNPFLTALLSLVPASLWIGERIYQVCPAGFAEENGVLVITSHAIYFIDKPQGYKDSRWLIIPYGQISGAPVAAASGLAVTYLDAAGIQNNVFRVEPAYLELVITAIHQARADKQYLTKLKTTCTRCGHTFEDYTDTLVNEPQCHSCGGQYQRSII